MLANKIWCHNSRISNLEEAQKFGQKRRQLLRITSWMLLSRVVVCTWCMPDASCILQPVWLLLLISYHHICCHGTHATPCHVFFSSCILQYIQRHANVFCSFGVAPPKNCEHPTKACQPWCMPLFNLLSSCCKSQNLAEAARTRWSRADVARMY